MQLLLRMVTSAAVVGAIMLAPARAMTHAVPTVGRTAAHSHATGKVTRARAQVRDGAGSQPQLNLTPAYVASVIGVDEATLQQNLASGETLLQIAGSKYSSAADLATALLARFKTKIDYAVSGGELAATQADAMYAELFGAAEKLVTAPHPQLAPDGNPAGGPKGQAQGDNAGSNADVGNVKQTLISTVIAACHTTMDAFQAAVAPGNRSILAVCQLTAPGMSVDSLVAAIEGAVQSKLAAEVSAGQLTAAQQSATLAKMQANLAAWLTTPVGAQTGGTKS